jgi:hypothetical protein
MHYHDLAGHAGRMRVLDEQRAKAANSGYTIAQIAGHLNAEGFHPSKRSPVFTPNAVSGLLRTAGTQRPASRPAITARPCPSTSGGCATWPGT